MPDLLHQLQVEWLPGGWVEGEEQMVAVSL
jgi:hypothetical protein